MAADQFFTGMFEVDVKQGEFLSAIRFPAARPGQRFGFQEFSPRYGDFATALVAVSLTVTDGVVQDVRIAHGAVQESPGRIAAAEAALNGQHLSAATISAAAEATAEIQPTLQNYHGDEAFKADLLRSLTARALHEAAGEGEQ